MRKLRNKLLLSILTVALTFIALGTTTFAWFSLGSSAAVNAFEATVDTPDGIEVSLDGASWGYSVDLEEAAKDLLFKDVTSVDGKAFLVSKEKQTEGNAVAGEDFFQTKIYVRTTGEYTDLKLTEINYTSNPIPWVSDANFGEYTAATDDAEESWEYKVGETYTFDAINAVRISFVSGTTAKVAEVVGENNKGSVDKTDAGLVLSYLAAKEKTVETHLDITPVTSTQYVDEKESEYDKIAEATTPLTIIENGAFDAELTDGDLTLKADGYKYAVLTINVWIEGWDSDCINAILSGKVKLGFKFEASFEAPSQP